MVKLLFPLLLLMSACWKKTDNDLTHVGATRQVALKKGDVLVFQRFDSNYIAAIMMDYTENEGAIWYGLCFTNYLGRVKPTLDTIVKARLYGRKIKSNYYKRGYYNALDYQYVPDSVLNNSARRAEVLGNLSINEHKLEPGKQSSSTSFNDLMVAFNEGRKSRSLPPTGYWEHGHPGFRPDQYFKVKFFLSQ